MSANPKVNRYLRDKAFDHIDHALGRPVNPLRESYRNYFATDADSDHARTFASSPFWKHNGTTDCGMAYYRVTATGRQALKDHLASIGDTTRAYAVTYRGHTFTVPAKSAAAAKYDLWLDASDNGDITFSNFIKEARARLA